MNNKRKGTALRIITVVTFLIMIITNALANTLPLNNVSTGDVSLAYDNLFAPAALTFAIWGLIYFLLLGYVLYSLGLFRERKSEGDSSLLRKTEILFSISSVANAGWIFCWHYDLIPLSMILMLVILLCLALISRAIQDALLTSREKIFIRLPFSVYFGWITVATIANATVLLVSLGWTGFGVSEPVWTEIILLVGLAIGLMTTLKHEDIAYVLVLIWAYTGILIKHISASGFNSAHPALIYTLICCLALFVVAIIHILRSWYRRKLHPYKED